MMFSYGLAKFEYYQEALHSKCIQILQIQPSSRVPERAKDYGLCLDI